MKEYKLSKSVFISHAVRDKAIVEHLVDLIEDGIGVPENEIFCSSLDGYGIPTGDNFITYIKSQMQQPKVVILLLTPSYFESHFCVSELGAAWVMSHKVFPIIVPPLSYDAIKDVLTGTQAININDDIKYHELKGHLVESIEFQPKSAIKWDTKRRAFLKNIKAPLQEIAMPSDFSKEEYELVCKSLKDAESELDNYEEELSNLKGYIKKLEAAKNKNEVEELKQQHNSTGITSEFESALSKIAEYKNILGDREVLKFVLCQYYDKPYRIDHYQYSSEFEKAARYNFVTLEDGYSVNWDNTKIKILQTHLENLSGLTDNDNRSLELIKYYESKYEQHVPLELDNQEFWEFHYKI